MIDLAGAEPRQVVDRLDLARNRQIAQAAGVDGGSHFLHGQPWLIRNRYQLFAPGCIRSGDDRHGKPQPILRESAGQRILYRGEADHFAADFRKALQPAQDEEEAVGVDSYDVASVVPAAERLELRIGFRVEVAAHDVGSAHK